MIIVIDGSEEAKSNNKTELDKETVNYITLAIELLKVPINIVITKIDELEIEDLIVVKEKITNLSKKYSNMLPAFFVESLD